MHNDEIKKYLIQLRDILNQIIIHPKEVSGQKVHRKAVDKGNEIHVYLIPLLLEGGYFEEYMGEQESAAEGEGEGSLVEHSDLKYEINAFDKAFMKKWGLRF